MAKDFRTQEVKAVEQKVFDVVATHLFAQGKPALENNFCQYRTKGGLKCAVGALITDESWEKLRRKAFENGSVETIVDLLPEAFEPTIPAAMATYTQMQELLYALQRLHDSAADANFSVALWKQALCVTASNFGLSIANVPQLAEFWWENTKP